MGGLQLNKILLPDKASDISWFRRMCKQLKGWVFFHTTMIFMLKFLMVIFIFRILKTYIHIKSAFWIGEITATCMIMWVLGARY